MLCRLCVYDINNSNMFCLFDVNGESEYLKLIAKHMRLQVVQDDNLPKVICNDCANHLNEFDVFCKFVEKRQTFLPSITDGSEEIAIEQAKLDELIGDKADNGEKSLPAPKNEFPAYDEESNDFVNNDFEDEIGNDVQNNSGDDRFKDSNKTLEEVNEDESYTSNNSKAKGESSKTDDSIPDIESKQKVVRRVKARCRISKKQKLVEKAKKKRMARQNAESDDEWKDERSEELSKHEQLIAQHMTVKCEQCGKIEATFLKLQMHYRKVHDTAGYLKCCGKVFLRRYRLYEHLKFHLNPELYKCEICGKNLKSRNCYKKHKQDKHPSNDQLKYICEICGKKHANKHSAQKHREMHNTERVSCNVCNKSFKTKYSLEYHVKKMHDQLVNPYICDTCGKEYKCKLSFNKHVAEHQGIVTKKLVQCELCEEWVVRLDKHMDRHNHTDVTCQLCGKISTSKSGLRSHMEKIHRPCPNLPCQFCDKTFKYKKNLKEHIAMHTNTKDYKCKHCEREFRSSANMYSHVKRYHAEQWMEARSKKGPTVSVETETVTPNTE